MILCITNQCNRRCDYCSEGTFKDGPERRMTVADVQRLCRFASVSESPGRGVAVTGGEPTLHPELPEILDAIQQANPTTAIQIQTHLLCDPGLLERISAHRLGALVNVGGFAGYSGKEQERLHSNLALARNQRVFRGIGLAVTITDENQDFAFLYDILRRDAPMSIGGIRIAIAAPGMGFANRFPREFSLGYGEKYFEIVKHCHQIRPSFTFVNECYVTMCMMSPKVFSALEPIVRDLNAYCVGNTDILPGFSAHWCFAFEGIPEMSIPNVFDYRDMAEVAIALRTKAAAMETDLDRQCDTSRCTSVKCLGPCLAVKYYRKHLRA